MKEVWEGIAYQTRTGLEKKDLGLSKKGTVRSKAQLAHAKRLAADNKKCSYSSVKKAGKVKKRHRMTDAEMEEAKRWDQSRREYQRESDRLTRQIYG